MKKGEKTGRLYIVATPVGNMEDITLRALKTLRDADIIASEDTRETGKLLQYHNIGTGLTSFHEHNEKEKSSRLVNRIKNGENVALVSDAGTPLVSDPGYRLVQEALLHGVEVAPVPGPCAAVTALSVSGLATDSFAFIGFLPKKTQKLRKELRHLAKDPKTVIIYESKTRILSLLKETLEIFGDRPAVLAREMTKQHEEFIRGRISDILAELEKRPSIKGEFTLLVSGDKDERVPGDKEIEKEIRQSLKQSGLSLSDLSRDIAGRFGLPRKKVYEMALKIKKETNPE